MEPVLRRTVPLYAILDYSKAMDESISFYIHIPYIVPMTIFRMIQSRTSNRIILHLPFYVMGQSVSQLGLPS